MKIGTQITLVAIMAATTMTTAFAQGTGAENYKAKCQMCHAADGSGNKGMKVPSFKDAKASDDLTAAVKDGKGTGTVKMPAYAGKLTDAQIKDVVTFVKSLK